MISLPYHTALMGAIGGMITHYKQQNLGFRLVFTAGQIYCRLHYDISIQHCKYFKLFKINVSKVCQKCTLPTFAYHMLLYFQI